MDLSGRILGSQEDLTYCVCFLGILRCHLLVSCLIFFKIRFNQEETRHLEAFNKRLQSQYILGANSRLFCDDEIISGVIPNSQIPYETPVSHGRGQLLGAHLLRQLEELDKTKVTGVGYTQSNPDFLCFAMMILWSQIITALQEPRRSER